MDATWQGARVYATNVAKEMGGMQLMRVLLVEDEKRLAENVARALREGAGFAVDIASDGEEGIYLA